MGLDFKSYITIIVCIIKRKIDVFENEFNFVGVGDFRDEWVAGINWNYGIDIEFCRIDHVFHDYISGIGGTSIFKTDYVMQVFSNLEAAREANEIFKQRSAQALPANIAEIPKFHEPKTESLELSDSAKETFARIGLRAREAFIEEQIERACTFSKNA